MHTYPCARSARGALLGALLLAALPAVVAQSVFSYYRFEEGTAGSPATGAGTVVNSLGSGMNGTAFGSPLYSSDVAVGVVPQTGAANGLSLYFYGGQSLDFAGETFLFHNNVDATIEFYLKAPNQSVKSLLWSRQFSTDNNRFNFEFWDGRLNPDYRAPGGTARYIDSVGYPYDTWFHFALTRTVEGNGSHTYRTYLDGVLQNTFSDTTPDLPTSSTWYLSGRAGEQSTFYIDELRLTQAALSPSQFLNATAVPESPAAAALAGALAFGIGLRRRRPRSSIP